MGPPVVMGCPAKEDQKPSGTAFPTFGQSLRLPGMIQVWLWRLYRHLSYRTQPVDHDRRKELAQHQRRNGRRHAKARRSSPRRNRRPAAAKAARNSQEGAALPHGAGQRRKADP